MQRLVLVSLAAVAPPPRHLLSWPGQGASSATAPAQGLRHQLPGIANTPATLSAESTIRKELQASQTEYQKLQAQLDSAVQLFDQAVAGASRPRRGRRSRKDLQAMQSRVEQRSTELQERSAAA